MKVVTEKEFEGIPHGEWLDCADALPPVGWEVVVKTVDGKITALTRFIRYEDAPAEHGYWDNNYPGKGNLYLFKSVVSWCKLPSPDSTFSAQLATITAQRDELLTSLNDLIGAIQFTPLGVTQLTAISRARSVIAKCEVQPIEPVIGLSPCAYDAGEGVQIQACQNASGVMWAIRKNGEVLGKAGYWDYEPIPSQRDKEFLTDFRFGSHVEAAKCLAEYRKGEVKNDA